MAGAARRRVGARAEGRRLTARGGRSWRVGAVVLGLVIGRVALGAALWRPGWSALSEDDFHRVALAQVWASRPFFLISPDMIWLPLQAWTHGLAFLLVGRFFAADPMLLVAVVNSAAVLGTAALVGLSAVRLFASTCGGLIAFAVVLFAPYAVFTSLSGLSEPLYYLAVALAVWGVVAWATGRRTWPLAVGSLGVAASGALRYEGWLLAASWLVIVAFAAADAGDPSFRGLLRAWWRRKAELVVAATPLIVPAVLLAVYAVHYGTMLGFLKLQAEMATAGAIEIRGPLDRWLYYPLPLWKSAPVLLPALVALAVWAARAMPVSQLVIGLVSLHFAVFCVLSGSSGAAGGFRERFLFAFVIALAPLLGALPLLYDRLRSRRVRRIAVGLVAIVAVGAAAHGLRHPPQEYTPAADLLQLAESLGATARAVGRPLALVMGPGTERDAFYLQVPNGRRLSVVSAATHGMRDPVALPAWVDVWVERLPSRVAAIPLDAGRVIGRYHLYGHISARVPEPEPTLAGWSRRDEAGVLAPIVPTRPLALEFAADDPRPSETVAVERSVPRGPHPRWGSLHIRRMYGLGSYRGRILVEVHVDGRVVFRSDIARPGGADTAAFVIPAGAGQAVVAVVLTAQPGIERGWGWGRASTTLITDFRLDDRPAVGSRWRAWWGRD